MDVNFITVTDVLEGQDKGRLVQIKCKNCPTKGYIKNTFGKIKDYIKSNLPLNFCDSCGIKTEIVKEQIRSIERIVEN